MCSVPDDILVLLFFRVGLLQGVGLCRHVDAFDGQLDFRRDQIAQHVVHLKGVLAYCIAAVVDIAFFAQRRHQGGEHRLVEELRRVDAVQHRQTLRHDAALFLQRAAVDARVGAEDRHGDGVALQGFAHPGGQQLQRANTRRVQHQLVAFVADQLLTDQLVDQRLQHLRQLFLVVMQEQLGFQHRVDHADLTQQFGARYPAMMHHDAGDQRR